MGAIEAAALVESLISIILKLVPLAQAKDALDAAGIKQAEAIADAAEEAKLASGMP
jgi:hypothetical protein